MGTSETNYRELATELDARGWTWADLIEWLQGMDHFVNPRTVTAWTDADKRAQGAEVPRWPVLLLQGVLGTQEWPRLAHFQRVEFGTWAAWMHPGLLRALDHFRACLDAPLKISKAGGALGRHLEGGSSMHNVDRVGYVMAADVILPRGFHLSHALQLAMGARVFGGIGLYPDWAQGPGMHVDVRHLSPWNKTLAASPRTPALWSAVKGAGGAQVYHAVEFVLGGR